MEAMADERKDSLTVREVCGRIRGAGTKEELGERLACEVMLYSLSDLQLIGGKLYREVIALPSPYREAISPYFTEQIFGAYHTLIAMHRRGEFASRRTPLADPGLFSAYCAMVEEGCFCRNGGRPVQRLFYYLVAAFAMFVLDRPGHPMGTPFPGGFTVEDRGGAYNCPIRDKEKDVPYSICNYCPARQSELP
ncbi:MAG: DUF2115 domain-containing protein [Methanomicrobiaceae archaeon]|nr:DUF2115 domain-containing protein [Methanomicrobiaceae archaeon]